MRRLVAAVFLVERRDIAEQAGKDAAVNRTVSRRAKDGGLFIDGLEAVERRRELEVVALAQHVEQLRMDVAPLAHPRVAEKMIAAEAAQPRLREAFELVVPRVPDVEEREEIGV